MGLTLTILDELLRLKYEGALDHVRRVVDIGAQQLTDDLLAADWRLNELYRLFGRPRVDLGRPVGRENFTDRAPSAAAFWRSLGMEYTAIDYAAGADVVVLDLNRGRVPWRLRGRFDLVINAGTTEHVVNQGCAFKIIHDLARPGALMIHEVPAAGLMPHGLINYDLKFFWHLCRENSYGVDRLGFRAHEPFPLHPDIRASNAHFGMGEIEPIGIPVLVVMAVLRKADKAKFRIPVDVAMG